MSAIFVSSYPGHTIGEIWIEAKSPGERYFVDSKTLTLKQNGNFTLKTIVADFSCTISGSFKKTGDTIFFDEKSIERTGAEVDTAYIITKNRLIPIRNADNSREFIITEAK